MIIKDKDIKYTLANNWILRYDPYYVSHKHEYSAYDINTGRTLYISGACYTILKIFQNHSLSFPDLYAIVSQKNINVDWEGFWSFCKKIEPLNFFVLSELPLHKEDEFPDGNGVCNYAIPIASIPFSAEVHFTHKCNLKCKHCFQNSSPLNNRYGELNPLDWISIFRQFESFRMHNITLSGGEIMFYPYFSEVFNEIVNMRLNYTVLTNGTLVNAIDLKALSKSNVSLTISLDGHSDMEHDMLRGKGAFKKTISNIETLVAHNAKVSLAYTINAINYLHLEEAIKLAISLGVKSLVFGFTDRIGRATENLNLILSNSQRKIVRHDFSLLREKYMDFLNISLLEVSMLDYNYKPVSKKLYCTAGTSHIAVSSDGKLYPCIYAFGHKEFLIGDLTKESLKNLWENRDKWKVFRNGFNLEDIDTCSSCVLAPKCSLKVCRLRNYEQNNSLYNKPIECALDYSLAL